MKITDDEIDRRIEHHAPTPAAVAAHQGMRAAARNFLYAIQEHAPDSREAALAVTKAEEALMWSNAAIARNHDKL